MSRYYDHKDLISAVDPATALGSPTKATRDIITRGVHGDLSEASENPGLMSGE